MLTLVLSRHGATPRSDPEQHLGQRIDIELSEAGRSAAQKLGERLQGVAFDRIITSPLRRARETAEIALGSRAGDTDRRIAEMDYGEWEGLTYPEIDARFATERRAWEADPAAGPCPGGESGDDVARRVRSFLEELLRPARSAPEAAGESVLVVAHSSLNRVLLCVALGVPIREYRRRFRQDPANLTVLRFPDDQPDSAQLLLCNDLAHIRGTRGRTWG